MGTVFFKLGTDLCSKMPMIKFSYFDIEAKGELTRLLLHAGNFDFEDDRLPISSWPGEHKEKTTFGQLPILSWDGVELAQSMAIARFVARRAGLAGRTDLEFVQADMVACHYEDVWTKLPKMMFAASQEERETLLKKRGGGWFAGSSATFADYAVMVVLDFLNQPDHAAFKDMNNLAERKKILDSFPLVKANYQKTSALPDVLAWKAKKPAFGGF